MEKNVPIHGAQNVEQISAGSNLHYKLNKRKVQLLNKTSKDKLM